MLEQLKESLKIPQNNRLLFRLQFDLIGNILRLSKVLEQKLVEVTQQLEKQCELHTETLRRAKRLEEEKKCCRHLLDA